MLTVHHLNNSRSQRILWLLEELEVPYEVKNYYRDPKTFLAPKELLDIHPLGKSPVITDDEVTLAESGAVIEYIIRKYGNGKFSTTSEREWTQNAYYTHYAEGSLMPIIGMGLIFRSFPDHAPWFVRPLFRFVLNKLGNVFVDAPIIKNSKFLESRLGEVKWLAGGLEPTAADFIMIFPLECLGLMQVSQKNVKEYVQRVHERPAYKRAIEKGGAYAYA